MQNYRASHIILDYLQALTSKYARIILEKPIFFAYKFLYKPYTIFLNDAFFLNFLISPKTAILGYKLSNMIWNTLYSCLFWPL